MPFLRIQTNTTIAGDRRKELLHRASGIVSRHLGKDEAYFMGLVEPDREICLAGKDDPAAFVELEALGLPGEKTEELSAELCALIAGQTTIPQDRIYVKFCDVPRGMWGWNGGVF